MFLSIERHPALTMLVVAGLVVAALFTTATVVDLTALAGVDPTGLVEAGRGRP